MYLRDIMATLTNKMPSQLREDDWIVYLNAAIRRYGKALAVEDCYKFNAAAGLSTYPLPKYVADGIKGVTVSGRELTVKLYGDELTDGSYFVSPTGYMTLSFTPPAGEPILVLFSSARSFKPLQEFAAREDLSGEERKKAYDTQECGIYEDCTDCIILGAMAEYAETMEDIAAADNYRNQCEQILRRAGQSRYAKRGKYPKTKAVAKWRRYLSRH